MSLNIYLKFYIIYAFSFLIIKFHFKVSACKMSCLLIGSTAKAAIIVRNASPPWVTNVQGS